MPLFSQKQIDRVAQLMTENNLSVNDVAEIMSCNIRDAWKLIKAAKQHVKIKTDVKHYVERPPAQYSNKRIYDLI